MDSSKAYRSSSCTTKWLWNMCMWAGTHHHSAGVDMSAKYCNAALHTAFTTPSVTHQQTLVVKPNKQAASNTDYAQLQMLYAHSTVGHLIKALNNPYNVSEYSLQASPELAIIDAIMHLCQSSTPSNSEKTANSMLGNNKPCFIRG
jgi:hypothetical protein